VRFAVLDLETTGIYPGGHDRVLEIGIVSLGSSLGIDREYATLVNPDRDVGPTWLHGIKAGEVLEAPAFEDVAGSVVDLLSNSVIVGHNVLFDLRFLEAEFARVGSPIGRPPYFDTMSVSVRMGAGSRRLEVEPTRGLTAFGAPATDLPFSGLRPPGRCHDRGASGFTLLRGVVGEQQGRQGPLHVEPNVVGQHAQEDVGPNPVVTTVAHGVHLQMERLHDPERLLDLR
jgi:hypothetical protein